MSPYITFKKFKGVFKEVPDADCTRQGYSEFKEHIKVVFTCFDFSIF